MTSETRRLPGTVVYWEPDQFPDAREMQVGPISMRVPGEFVLANVPELGFNVAIRFGYNPTLKKIGPTSMELQTSRFDEFLTASSWRRVNVGELWEQGMRAILLHELALLSGDVQPDRFGSYFLDPSNQPANVDLMRARGPEAATLERVAAVYNMADMLNLAPVKEVQRAFSTETDGILPRPTAAKWVQRARQAGLITPEVKVQSRLEFPSRADLSEEPLAADTTPRSRSQFEAGEESQAPESDG